MRILRSRRLVHALIGVIVFLAVAGLYWLENFGRVEPILSNWEYGFRDNMLTVGGWHIPPDSRLVFLGIDEASRSLSTLDLQNPDLSPGSPEYRALTLMIEPWPWSREVYALLCERLLTAGARAVVFDITFPRPGPGDEALQDVLRRFPDKVVLGSNLVLETIGPGQQAWAWSIPASSILPGSSPEHPSVGYVVSNFWPEFNGIIRRAQYQTTLEQLQGGIQPNEVGKAAPSSLALRAATRLEPVHLSQPFQPHLFRYTGPPGTYPAIPLYQVFAY